MAQWQSLLSGGRMACQGKSGHLVDSLRQTGSQDVRWPAGRGRMGDKGGLPDC